MTNPTGGPPASFLPANGSIPGDQRAASHDLTGAHASAQSDGERMQMLHGELQHRVRNMLAIVRSIFARTIAAGGELEDIANHFNGRLDVLARYQQSRGIGPGASMDFETMVHDELQSVQASGDARVTCQGPEVRVPPETAQMLGLALHELVTNSIKFGTLSLPSNRGTLAISWSVEPDSFHLAWEERGMAVLRPAPPRHGFGREFIEQAMPYQLGARTALVIGPGAISCDIRVPLWDKDRGDSMNHIDG